MQEPTLFREYLKIKGLSELSIHHYMRYYNKFGDPLEFNQDKVNEFLLEHNNHPPVRAFINNLKTFLLINCDKFGLDDSNLRKIEVVKKTGAKAFKIPNVLSEKEVFKIEKGFNSERNKVMFHYNFYCGLRVSELISIGIFDFKLDWKEVGKKIKNYQPLQIATLIIRGKRGKERPVYVSPSLLRRTFKLLIDNGIGGQQGDNTPIFNIGERRWEQLLARASKRSIGKHVYPHILRHSCASWLYNDKGWGLKEIAEYLGHESVSTTEIYTHISNKKMRDKFEEIFKETKEPKVSI